LGRKKTLQCQATTSTRSIVRAILQESKSHGDSEWLTFYFRDTIYDRTQLMNKAKAAKPWNRTASEFERAKW
jgi:chlorite dismutase